MIDENVLYQCTRDTDYQPVSAVELGGYTINSMDNTLKRKFTFELYNEKNLSKIFGANDQVEYDSWILAMQQAIEK